MSVSTNQEAIAIYDRILKIDDSLYNVWFNKAHAHVKIADTNGALESIKMTLKNNSNITAAQHMLKALSEEEAIRVSRTDEAYIKDLFDNYAPTYDSHGKKLLYAAPRVIRQELAKIYKERYGFDGNVESSFPSVVGESMANKAVESFVPAQEPVGSSCQTYTSFMNGTLDILDLGCGTGQAGAWLKDYAKSLVGVDLSTEMIKVAGKKMLYQELHNEHIDDYLRKNEKDFDIVVASDVFAYVGDLSEVFQMV